MAPGDINTINQEKAEIIWKLYSVYKSQTCRAVRHERLQIKKNKEEKDRVETLFHLFYRIKIQHKVFYTVENQSKWK